MSALHRVDWRVIAQAFGHAMTELRTEHQLTQEQAGRTVGISQSQWSDHENGMRHSRLDHLIHYSDSFGRSPHWLLARALHHRNMLVSLKTRSGGAVRVPS